MRLDEYLDTVASQIRYTKIRGDITEELKNHILDQAEFYEAQGAFPEEAMERAVREMGDPVETGVSLDRIHRPQMNWGIVIGIGVISLFSIGIIFAANELTTERLLWDNQAIYSLLGFLFMMIVYRIDYSILGKSGWYPAAIFLFFLITGTIFFGISFNGSIRFIDFPFTYISIQEIILLYVPLFGAALYAFRGDDYRIFLKLIPLFLLPVFFLMKLPDLSSACVLFVSLLTVFLFASFKDWFRINKKWTIGVLGGFTLLFPVLLIGYFFFFGQIYQKERILAFFIQTGDANYLTSLVENLRKSSSLIGSNQASLELFSKGPAAEYLTDYILVATCSIYGTLAAVAILAGLIAIILKLFQISTSQKNQLGMITGISCSVVFLIKTAVSILVNLQLIPYVSISMPFLSYGGSGIVVSYILLGLVLSVYRYKNILPKEASFTKKRRYLKITWELRD